MDVLKKRWLKILFMMSFVLTLVLPAKAVKAADYDVWVNGEQFTDAKTSITCGSGTAVYDNATKTLTLTNATIDQSAVNPKSSMKCLIYTGNAELNIVFGGTNVLDGKNNAADDYDYGITAPQKLTIKGKDASAKLTIQNICNGISVNQYETESTNSLTLENANIDISAKTTGTYDYGDCIEAVGDLAVTGCTLNLTATGGNKNAIVSHSSKVVVFKNSTINIKTVASCISVGDSGSKEGGVQFDNCKVTLLKNTVDAYGGEPEKQYAVELQDSWDDTQTPSVNLGVFRTFSIIGGGSFETDVKTGVTNQTTASKITLPKGSSFYQSGNAADGWGNQIVGSKKVKITIGTGTALIDGSGKDAGSGSGGGEGGGSGNGNGGGGNGGGSGSGNGGGNGTGDGNGSGNGGGNGSGGNGSGDRATQKGEDGTFLSKGASMEAAESFLLDYSSESDPAGTSFGILCARSTKTTNNSVKVNWKKVSGASKYLVFAAKCGKGNKVKQIAETTGTSYNLKKLDGAKIKKGTYYKFVIVAIDGSNDVIATSKMVHSATLGGKVGNCKTITTKAKKNKVSLKAKKTFKLKAKQTAQKKSLKIKKHRADQYESSDEKVATVNKKGVIKGVAPGKCSVFVYAQNGVYKEIKVTVK